MITKSFKEIIGLVAERLLDVIEEVDFQIRRKRAEKRIVLLTPENSPALLQAVTEELRAQEGQMVLGALQDLEKAVYHVAAKQHETMERQKHLEELVVASATSVDELLNGMELVATNEYGDDEEEESDEEALDRISREGKKGVSSLN